MADGQVYLPRESAIERANPNEQEGDSRTANAGEDCGSALAHSNPFIYRSIESEL